jgi:hypothetical protein
MMIKEKYGETTTFIKDTMKFAFEKDGHQKLQVNGADFKTFLINHGLAKETIKQYDEAMTEYYNGTVSVVNDILMEQPKLDKVTLNTRTSNGTLSTRIVRQKETHVPVTGEPITKFGVVSLKINLKMKMDKSLLEECAKEIEEATNKK